MGSWKEFWTKIWGGISSRLTENNVKKVNAALGSFLLTIMGLFTPVVTHYANLWFNTLLADFVIGSWLAAVILIGVWVVTFFGTTESVQKAEEAAAETETPASTETS